MTLILESPSFSNQRSPESSPPTMWTYPLSCFGVSLRRAREWALVIDDPDAPTTEPWVHWLLYNLAPEHTGLPGALPAVRELAQPARARQGLNSWGTIGYRGPAPPPGHGVHRYHFRLYALSKALGLPPAIPRERLMRSMAGHVLDEGLLIGTYQPRRNV